MPHSMRCILLIIDAVAVSKENALLNRSTIHLMELPRVCHSFGLRRAQSIPSYLGPLMGGTGYPDSVDIVHG